MKKLRQPSMGFLVGSILMQACMVGPDYVRPEVDLPDAWHEKLVEGLAEGDGNLHKWWTVLADPVLDRLIERAVDGNLDLKAALARIEEGRAAVGLPKGELFPQFFAGGFYSRDRASENGILPLPPGAQVEPTNLHSLGLDTGWELDLFGRVRRSIEAAEAGLQASIEDFRDVLVLLLAEIGRTYVDVRTFQTRIRLARKNVESQRKTLKLTKDRFKAELAPELDVAQAELNLARSESVVPILEIGHLRAAHRLSVLLGLAPGDLRNELSEAADVPNLPEEARILIPADLLRQRPDIRRAERRLASQTALIGVATADLYPRLSLSGNFGFEAGRASDLLTASSRTWGVTPSIQWNIFAGGSVVSRIEAEEARTKQALVHYKQSVLVALEQVENSLVAYNRDRIQKLHLIKAVAAAKRSVTLVQSLYKSGNTSFLNVLDAERSLFALEDQLAQAEGIVVKDLIQLYQAMGGGWSPGEGSKK